MTGTTTATSATPPAPLIRQRRRVVAVCCLATCARQLEPPLWIFQPPPTSAWSDPL
jgi:hypothetical protein